MHGDFVLVAYATNRGSTAEVANAIARILREHGLEVEVRDAADVEDLSRYDGVLLGGALYFGRLHDTARHFLERHRDALATKPVAVFGMGPQTLGKRDVAHSRAQLERALAKFPQVQPVSVAIFGGVVDPAKLKFPFNRMAPTDARDWSAIHAWADEVAGALTGRVKANPKALVASDS